LTEEPFRLFDIGQIAVPVRDLDRAVAFYRDTLSMRFLFRVPAGLAFFDCHGVRLMLSVPEGGTDVQRSSIIYYKVGDIRDSTQRLKQRGVAFQSDPHLIAKMPDHELWMAFFHDSEGNTLALMSEVRG